MTTNNNRHHIHHHEHLDEAEIYKKKELECCSAPQEVS